MANKNPALEALIEEYQNSATSKEEQIVIRKLQLIKAHLLDCGEEEFVFADEIVSELCRIIKNMKEQSEKTAVEAKKASMRVWIRERSQTALFLVITKGIYPQT